MQFLPFFFFFFFLVFFSSRRRVRWKWWTFLFVLFFFSFGFFGFLFFFNLKSTVRSTTGSVEFFFNFIFFFVSSRSHRFAAFVFLFFSELLLPRSQRRFHFLRFRPFPPKTKQTNKTKQQNKEKTGSMMSIRIDPVPSNRCSRSRAVKCGKTM